MPICDITNSPESESELFQAGADWDKGFEYGDFVLLYHGAYADTYRASKGGKYFLLKTPKSGDTANLNILRREFEVSACLDHPNIISAFTFENIQPLGPCLVMQYVEGDTLVDYLKGNPGAKPKKRILSQLLSAVGYLHGKGIVHNDLKPANIIISRGGSLNDNLKLIDFGLSDDDAHYLFKTPGCTPEYASPELLSECGRVDARSDIYSVGKLIQLMFPHRYSLIWHKCTRFNPRRRYRSADSIVHAIRTCKAANVWVVVLILLAIAAVFVLPPVSRIVEYNNEVGDAEQRFKVACEREGVPVDKVPQFSMSSYFSFGQKRAAREDSLKTLMDQEFVDRIVRRDAVRSLDSLYTTYTNLISLEKYRTFGLVDAGHFYREFKELSEAWLGHFANDDNWHSFYSFSENQRREYYTVIVSIARALLDYGDLPQEEIDFYDSLAKSGQPYRPYGK
jgi:serine/threonine protein kinase